MTCIKGRRHAFRIGLYSALLAVLGLVPLEVAGQEAPPPPSGTNTVFVVDTSGSMKRNAVFASVQKMLVDYIRQLQTGDHVILLAFDEEVRILADDEIHSPADIEKLADKVKGLKANGQWTYLTHALDITANQAERLQAANPKRKHLIYLFTDGKNEPPPGVKEAIPFRQVLEKRFKFFSSDQTYLYILSLVPPDPEMSDFAQQMRNSGGHAKIVQKMPEEPQLDEVELEASFAGATELQWKGGGASGAATLTVKRLMSASATRLHLALEVEALPAGMEASVEPEEIICREAGQVELLQVRLSGSLGRNDLRQYRARIRVSPQQSDVNVIPDELPFDFTLVQKSLPPALIAALLALALALAIFIFYRQMRGSLGPRTVWVSRQGESPVAVGVKPGQRSWLGEQASGPYTDLGLPRYYLAFGKSRALSLGDSATGEERAVTFEKPMTCVAPEGTVDVIIRDRLPGRADSGLDTDGTTSLPDSMRDI